MEVCEYVFRKLSIEVPNGPVVHSIHSGECYSVFKKKEVLPFMKTWVNLEGIMLSENSQVQKCKYGYGHTTLNLVWSNLGS